MKNILWLTSWYPNRQSEFNGDFLQRHAKAVALYCNIHVIHVVKIDASQQLPANEKKITGNLTEQIIYYHKIQTGIKFLDKYRSQKAYTSLYKKAILDYVDANGKPDLVHVQIAMKAGVVALWVQQKWNVPYMVSEQWTGYLPEGDLRVEHFSFVYRYYFKKIFTHAAAITTVSHYLGKAIQQRFPFVKYTVIPNVVDTSIFYPGEKQADDMVRFVHISNMTYQKNTEATLHAFKILKEKYTNIALRLYGTVQPALKKIVADLELEEFVFFEGEVSQQQLNAAMHACDALILYSRFETFGCVLIEANACGLPVIVSDIPVFHELVKEGENGLFVKENDPVELSKRIGDFIDKRNTFDHKAIATTAADLYNFNRVGKMFYDLYNTILIDNKKKGQL